MDIYHLYLSQILVLLVFLSKLSHRASCVLLILCHCFSFSKDGQLDRVSLGFARRCHPNKTHCASSPRLIDSQVGRDGSVTLKREILCGDGQVKGCSWIDDCKEREMGLGRNTSENGGQMYWAT